MSGKKGMLHYTVEVKKDAVRQVVEEGVPYEEVARRLGMRKSARIKVWVRLWRREGESSFHKPVGRPRREEAQERELERLRMENALLKKFHSELRKMRLAQRNIGRSTSTDKTSK